MPLPSFPSAHRPAVRTALLVVAFLVTALAGTATDAAGELNDDAPPGPNPIASGGLTVEALTSGIEATQADRFFGPDYPALTSDSPLAVGNVGAFADVLARTFVDAGWRVDGFRLPYAPVRTEPPTDQELDAVLSAAFAVYCGVSAHFHPDQRLAFFDAVMAASGPSNQDSDGTGAGQAVS